MDNDVTYYNEQSGRWEKAEPIPYYRTCLIKRIMAKIIWLLLGWWLKQPHKGE